MNIPFQGIPNTIRVPFVYVEFSNAAAQQGPAIQKYTTLIIGQRLSAGEVSELVPTVITSEAQARAAFGAGSMLHGMCKAYLDNDKVTEMVAIAQDDDGAAVAAGGEALIAGTATADGTLAFYIAGRKISVLVTEGDTAADVAAALVAAITAEDLSYCSAAVNGGTPEQVDLTAKNAGVAGNDIDLRFNYADDDAFPAGITGTIQTAMAGGTTNPDIDDVLGVLPETQYNVIIHPYTDDGNLDKLEAELSDRFGPIRQNDGVAFTAKIDTLANLTTLGNSRNSPHSSIIGAAGPSAPWDWASAWGGQVAKSAQADPAKPFQTLGLVGIAAPADDELFTLAERNNLLWDGIATYVLAAGGIVRIERAITTWQFNDAGAPDSSYLDCTTLFTLSYLRYSFRVRMQAKYSRHKLANDGTRFGPGQQVITPLIGRSEAVALFAEWESAGLVENIDQFKRDLIVERSAADQNRLDFLLPPDLINQLRVVGSQIQFLL